MGKQRIEEVFQDKLAAGQKLFVPYIMAGDGGLDILEERLLFLEECGASAVELGIPFSDPVADGPTIQDAGIRALRNGTTLTSVFETLEGFRNKLSMPIIFMAYLNPIYKYGIEKFAADCEKAGVDGLIIPDLPLEEEALVVDYLQEKSIALIRLAALTSPEERLREIAKRTEGFLYAVSVTGTTGARAAHQANVINYLRDLKEITDVPVLAGFGVSNPEQGRELGSACDGVIVGSKIVELLYQDKIDEVKRLIQGSIYNTSISSSSTR
ncbi:tryptophan synthase subunit alpha [Virgibacillus dakarensis]|uniref:Tryptophan synthase alpha chain n=1 Tax=Lentibacillus populi TaxID=1827502 RepID=A0A9W5X6H2_9BACI|nr:tryptophan synthase subunit alpha [Lentibacillus populi]MTW84562.1 tryptophan synthase subunit alpha [Virgibacillus dakarensis]GGB47602.1 tryptophan synthase alpha chain [Lentibacillus populi]